MSKKKEHKGKIPKKPEDERLSETVSAAVTEKMKADVKHEAEVEDESVSQLVRNSIKDIVYHDLHPEATPKQLVESGHEEHTEIKKIRTKAKTKEKKHVVVDQENTVSVEQMYEALRILKNYNKENTVLFTDVGEPLEIKFEKDSMTIYRPSTGTVLYVNIPMKNNFYEKEDTKDIITNYEAMLNLFHSSKADIATFSIDKKLIVYFNDERKAELEKMNATQSSKPKIDDIPYKSGKELAHIKSKDLLNLLQSLEYAMAREKLARNLHGIYFEFVNGQLIMTAVDGFRLGSLQFNINNQEEINFLISAEDVYSLIKTLSSVEDQDVKISIITVKEDKKYIWFSLKHDSEDIGIIALIVNENFPDYRRIVPQTNNEYDDFALKIELNAKELYDALKSMAAFYKKKQEGVYLILQKDSDFLNIVALNEDYGSGHTDIPVKVLKNELEEMPFICDFNPIFLMEALKALSSKGYAAHPNNEIEMYFKEPTKPLVIHPVGSKKVVAIIMPIRTDEKDKQKVMEVINGAK